MRRLLAVLLIAGACSGCAFTTDTIDIEHRVVAVPPVPGAAGVSVQVATVDRRSGDATTVGAKKNGYGMEMASIRSSRPAADIVQDALVGELRTRGFAIGPGGPSVAAEVIRFRNTFDTGFFSADARSDVTISVQVRNVRGEITYSRTVTGEGIEKGVQIMAGDNAKLSLDRALPDAIGRIVNDPEFLRALIGVGVRPVS